MNSSWQNFLLQQGATIEAGVVQRFGNLATELNATAQGTVLCDLSQYGRLRVAGADAESFLQNLLSNDIREASNTRAQLSSLNSAKGRMLATMMIWREGEDYLMQLPLVLAAAVSKKLSMYVLRSKVKITDISDVFISFGLSGPDAQAILTGQFGDLPQQQLGVASSAQAGVIRISDTRWQITPDVQHAQTLWLALSQAAQPAASVCWDWLNIRSGIPVILPQTQEQFVAQMANLDILNGVNFKKGCYPGQEIVARMQYLGKLKRRMYLAHVDTQVAPQPGDELFSADMEGQASGMIVNAAPAPSGGFDVLAVIQITSRETQTVMWKSLQGTALQFLPPPYPLV